MRIGVDFDNTIVCHDPAFRRAAVELGWIDPGQALDKSGLRDRMRAAGREDDWTRLQGHVYGPGTADAPAFPGVVDFFRRAVQREIAICIISHRTRRPYAGPAYDLHRAALNWLERSGFFDPAAVGLDRQCVYLEPSKEEKLSRIAALECTHFIDDLPELLWDATFPVGTQRLLFDPQARCAGDGLRRVHSWDQLAQELLAA